MGSVTPILSGYSLLIMLVVFEFERKWPGWMWWNETNKTLVYYKQIRGSRAGHWAFVRKGRRMYRVFVSTDCGKLEPEGKNESD
jgi:hypothetical protein